MDCPRCDSCNVYTIQKWYRDAERSDDTTWRCGECLFEWRFSDKTNNYLYANMEENYVSFLRKGRKKQDTEWIMEASGICIRWVGGLRRFCSCGGCDTNLLNTKHCEYCACKECVCPMRLKTRLYTDTIQEPDPNCPCERCPKNGKVVSDTSCFLCRRDLNDETRISVKYCQIDESSVVSTSLMCPHCVFCLEPDTYDLVNGDVTSVIRKSLVSIQAPTEEPKSYRQFFLDYSRRP